jgi:cytochrome c-type biogenesis protein CcmH
LSNPFHSGRLRRYVFIVLLALVACAPPPDRVTSLGSQLICICGCNQLLGSCTMINCSSSGPMRKELQSYVDEGMSDKEVLAAFVDKYGTKVLSAPPTSDWFNLSAWVMPFLALFAGGALVVHFLRVRQTATPAGPQPAAVDATRYQAEIEEELRKLTPED